MTKTEQAQELLKGCGERTGILNGMWICGEEPSKGIIKLCKSCQAKLSQFKQDAEEELRLLEEIEKQFNDLENEVTDGLGFDSDYDNSPEMVLYNLINKEIQDLKSALEVLGEVEK